MYRKNKKCMAAARLKPPDVTNAVPSGRQRENHGQRVSGRRCVCCLVRRCSPFFAQCRFNTVGRVATSPVAADTAAPILHIAFVVHSVFRSPSQCSHIQHPLHRQAHYGSYRRYTLQVTRTFYKRSKYRWRKLQLLTKIGCKYTISIYLCIYYCR